MGAPDKQAPTPTEIKLHQLSRKMEIAFSDGSRFELPYEFLRVYSPSAEVRGHGPGQENLPSGKREVGIEMVEPVGAYAIKPVFSDGHDSGLYSWDYLHMLGIHQERLWQEYLERLEAKGASRDALPTPPMAPGFQRGHGHGGHGAGGCGSGGCGH